MDYRKNTLQERTVKLHSRLLRKSSAIDALLYSRWYIWWPIQDCIGGSLRISSVNRRWSQSRGRWSLVWQTRWKHAYLQGQGAQLVETRGRFTWKRVQAIFMVFQGLWDDGSAVNIIRSWFDEREEPHNPVKSNRKIYLWWSTFRTTSTTPQSSKNSAVE